MAASQRQIACADKNLLGFAHRDGCINRSQQLPLDGMSCQHTWVDHKRYDASVQHFSAAQ
jgi:hypothetical protein